MDPNDQSNALPNDIPKDFLQNASGEAPPVYAQTKDGDFVVQQSLFERLLSPESLQRMMMVGGGMLVIGFVVWLWSIGLFGNPIVVALSMGGGIAALIAAGIAIVKFTRYQLAGNGLTLLGALAMPLQLWFYHAQGLIDLSDGGHLWIPAAVFCLIYAGIARVLRNPAFVYTLVGGVVLTGMLFMADSTVNQFWNLLPQVSFLVGLGWVCLFAEKGFVDTESDFSKARFGHAFRRSGVVTIAGGLLLLLMSQVVGILYNEIAFSGYRFVQYAPNVGQQCWAIGILLVTAIGVAAESGSFSYSEKRKSILIGLAVWIAVCLVGMLNLTVTATGIATVLAAAVLLLNVVSKWTRTSEAKTADSSVAKFFSWSKQTDTLALLLVKFALVQALLQFTFVAGGWWISEIGYASLAQISLAGLAAISGGWLATSKKSAVTESRIISNPMASTLSVLGGMAIVAALWTTANLAGSIGSPFLLAIAGLILPALIIGLGFVLKGETRELVAKTAAAMVTTHMISLLAFFFPGGNIVLHQWLWLVLVTIAAAIQYLCCWVSRAKSAPVRIGFHRFATYSYLIAAVAIVLSFFGMNLSLAMVSAPALIGLLLIVVGQFASSNLDNQVGPAGFEHKKLLTAEHAQWDLVANYGRVFVMFANSAAILWAINTLTISAGPISHTSFWLAIAIGIQLAAAIAAVLISKSEGWRNGFIGSAILLAVTQCAVVNQVFPYTLATKVEFVTVLVGVLLLGIGHVGWAREDRTQNASTTAALWFGSVMTVAPLMIALYCYRYMIVSQTGQFAHEVAVLVAILVTVAGGLLCRIRATTLVGAGAMTIYVGSLLTMIPLPEKLQSISVVMMAGGAIFFTTAILLSVYRERIIAIPERFREGQGLFQVLKWR